jgi:hypothetical protein
MDGPREIFSAVVMLCTCVQKLHSQNMGTVTGYPAFEFSLFPRFSLQ